jgi:hypothetical protein
MPRFPASSRVSDLKNTPCTMPLTITRALTFTNASPWLVSCQNLSVFWVYEFSL